MGTLSEYIQPPAEPVSIPPKPDGKAKSTEDDDLQTAIQSMKLLRRRMLVVINPTSGKGKTLSIFQTQIQARFESANISPVVFITGYAGHAKTTILKSNELDSFHGIAVFGGDGLINEVVNGLRLRQDAEQYLSLPIGIIAGGSGNGVARSIAEYAGKGRAYEHDAVGQTTKAISMGKTTAINLAEITLDDNKFYSVLSVGWGFVSDVDIGSEWLRRLGETRFYIWTIFCILRKRAYNTSLEYIPAATNNETSETPPAAVSLTERFVSIYSSVQSHIGTKFLYAPAAKANDGLINLTFIKEGIGRTRLTKFCTTMETGRHLGVRGVHAVQVKEFTITTHDERGFDSGNLTIDGERVTGQRINVKLSQSPLIVFTN